MSVDHRFSKLFFPGLTEERAIELLKTPIDELEDKSDPYVAAAHLVNFPTERSINALIEAVQKQNPILEYRIARRKAIETLGRLQATQALEVIRSCLADDDCYTVENAVWAIGEIGTKDPAILAEIAQLLDKPGQTYRVIIQVLLKYDYQPALEQITKFTQSDDPATASIAIATAGKFSGDRTKLEQVVEFLQHPLVKARRAAIQDLMDVNYYPAIPEITACPVSVVFRHRGIRHLADANVPLGILKFEEIEPSLDLTIWDHPQDLKLVHDYDQTPTLEFAINELYQTDFGRCYLATQTILECYPEDAPAALLATYQEKAHNDYGAHYHVVKLLGWLKHADSFDLLVEALHNNRPQFQKSRMAGAIALGYLGNEQAIPLLKDGLNTKIWELKYACLMALDRLGDASGREIATNDSDWLIRAKAAS